MTQIKMKNANEAEVSKNFMRKASIYGTEEYKLWRAFIAENPGYTMVTKKVVNSKSAEKKNATYENMEAYIRLLDESEKKLADFENIKKASKIQRDPYGNVLAWFDATYFVLICFNLDRFTLACYNTTAKTKIKYAIAK